MSSPRSVRTRPRLGGALVVLLLAALVPVVIADVASAEAITNPAGPLTRVEITPDLNCAVNYLGDSSPEFFGTTACATLVASGGTLYGPANIPAGGSASPRTPYTAVSQTVTGTGTAGDPLTISTVADAGTSGLQVRQRDTYVIGQETYRTDITVANTSSAATDAIVYKAADCYLQNSDRGFGAYDPATGAVSCVTSLDPGARIEQFYPLAQGSRYVESNYGDVWALVGTRQPFPDECRQCANNVDNGMGLSWTVPLAAGATATVSHLTNFSPLGNVPLQVTKTARDAQTPSGGSNAYTITVENPNISPVTLASVSDQLPTGFSYRPGTSTGASTTDPVVSGANLTWNGPITVGAGSQVALTFGVDVGSVAGTYFNQASAVAQGVYTVVPSGATAPVEVVGAPPPVNTPPVAADQSVTTPQDTPIPVTLTATDADDDPLTFAVATQPAHGVLTGTGAALTYTPNAGYAGPDSFTYTANDGLATSAPATVSITVTPTSGCPLPAPTVDVTVSSNQKKAADKFVSPAVTTSGAGELLIALISADGPYAPTQKVSSVTGAGLNWTLVSRANQTWGTTEVWQAYAPVPINGAKVTARLAKGGFDGTITVSAFRGAASSVGATKAASGIGTTAAATLEPTACNSLVWAVGHDWSLDKTPVPAAGQQLEHLFIDRRVRDTFWVQTVDDPTTDQAVTVSASWSGNDRWTLASVEIPAAPTS